MSDVQTDLKSLVTPTNTPKRLPEPAARPARPATSSLATQAAGSGTGISSPLTEPDFTTRETYDPELIATTDGAFGLEVKRLKKINLVDSAQRAVVIQPANKPATP